MTDEAAAAVANSFRFEAKKDKLGQLQSGQWVLTFKVKPDEVPYGLLTAAMGTRFMVAAVEVSDDETATEQPAEALETPSEPEVMGVSASSSEDAVDGDRERAGSGSVNLTAPQHQVSTDSPRPTTEAAPGQASDKTGEHGDDTSKSQEAGRFCNNPDFREFLRETQPETWNLLNGDVVEIVYRLCDVTSRKEFDRNQAAWQRWCHRMSDYRCWADAQTRLQRAGEG